MSQEVMKSISDALDMNPLTVQESENLLTEIEDQVSTVVELTQEEKEGEEDFALARGNIKNLMEKGEQALEQLCVIAAATEQPRAFEIVSTLLKTLVDSNKQLLDIHEKRRQLLPVVSVTKEEEKKANVTNNNLFVGTTEEFMRLLRDRQREEASNNVIEGEIVNV